MIHTGVLSLHCSTTLDLSISPSVLKPENVLVGVEISLSLEQYQIIHVVSVAQLPNGTILSRNDFGHPKPPGRPSDQCWLSEDAYLSHSVKLLMRTRGNTRWSCPEDISNLGAMVHVLSPLYSGS